MPKHQNLNPISMHHVLGGIYYAIKLKKAQRNLIITFFHLGHLYCYTIIFKIEVHK